MKNNRTIGLVVGLILIAIGAFQLLFPNLAGTQGNLPPAIDETGHYTAPQDVADYIHTYSHLPDNFITKAEAEAMGWSGGQGNLWDVAPGMSIGGDSFGNREGLLPGDVSYRECDVNYSGGYRGGERIVYGDDGSIYYTADHYESFEQLY